MIVTCHCFFFHPAKKLRSGAIVRFSDNSSFCGFIVLGAPEGSTGRLFLLLFFGEAHISETP